MEIMTAIFWWRVMMKSSRKHLEAAKVVGSDPSAVCPPHHGARLYACRYLRLAVLQLRL